MLNRITIRLGEEQMITEVDTGQAYMGDDAMGIPDLLIFEIRKAEDRTRLREVRERFSDAQLLLINRSRIPSLSLLEPGIAPAFMTEGFPEARDMMTYFHKMIMKVCRDRERLSPRERLLVRRGEDYCILPYSQIMYIEAKDKYIVAHCRQAAISYRGTLKSMEGKLPPCFIRCHRSMIVNLMYVYKVHLSLRHITLCDGTVVPLARSCRLKMRDTLTAWIDS